MDDDIVSGGDIRNLGDAPSPNPSSQSFLSGGTKGSPHSPLQSSHGGSRRSLGLGGSSAGSLRSLPPPVPDLSNSSSFSAETSAIVAEGMSMIDAPQSECTLGVSNRRRLDSPAHFNIAEEGEEEDGEDAEATFDESGIGGITDVRRRLHSTSSSRLGSQAQWSEKSDFIDYDDEPDMMGPDDSDARRPTIISASANTSEGTPTAIRVLGIPIPMWLLNGVSYTRVSTVLVRNAPCFWCCGRNLESSATDRSVLLRLNVLNAFFAVVQVLSGVWLAIMFYSPHIVERNLGIVSRNEDFILNTNLWNLNGSIFFTGLMGFVLFVTMIWTMRAIREVNLVGAIRYMWVLFWMLPLEVMMAVYLFDYHRVTEVWVKHWWSIPSLAWFRKEFCAPGTFNSECIVPIDGGALFESEEEWCQELYNATNCTAIRNDAQLKLTAFSYVYYNANAIWAVLAVCLLLLTINVLEGIITKPVVQRSREANVPTWLILPIVGCILTGAILLYSPGSVISASAGPERKWIAIVYIVSGACFFVAALLGWFISTFSILNSRDKQNKKIAVLLFLATCMSTVILMATLFSASIILSTNLVEVGFSDQERGSIACEIDTVQSCTHCDNRMGLRECPEWTTEDVTRVMQTQLKQSATLAAIFLIYSFSALRFGILLRKHISMYQIDYV